jgi:hypothetical protein
MFNGGSVEAQHTLNNCKRDLKRDAEQLNKRIFANREMILATKKFIKDGDFYELDRNVRDHHFTLLGALGIRLEEQEQGFDILLAQIQKEEENKDK